MTQANNNDTEILLRELVRLTNQERLYWTEEQHGGDLTARAGTALLRISRSTGPITLELSEEVSEEPVNIVVTPRESERVDTIAQDALRLARGRSKTLVESAHRIHFPQTTVDDDDGTLTLLRALSGATRNHSLEWHQRDDHQRSTLIARVAWLDLHLIITHHTDDFLLMFTATRSDHSSRIVTTRTDTATATHPHPPLQELLISINKAREQTVSELVEHYGDGEPSEKLRTLLTNLV